MAIILLVTNIPFLTTKFVQELTDQLKANAMRLGFALCGVTVAAQPTRYSKLINWLDAGYAGQMRYLDERREAYRHPSSVLDGCRTLLMLGFPYRTHEPPQNNSGLGRVARYAWNDRDYHDLIHDRLRQLKAWLVEKVPTARIRGIVDTAPLLEREFAEAAGIGWVGKNTLLLDRRFGSYFFLAALLTDLELVHDAPQEKGYCGTCRACLDACPTQAFPRPFVLDATRCISYLTIETKGEIPAEIAWEVGEWLFGCDICQEVCPWNRKAEQASQSQLNPLDSFKQIDLIELLRMDDATFRQSFRGTPFTRPKRAGMLRNAAVVLGNQQCEDAVPALIQLLSESEPMLRATAAEALVKIAAPAGVLAVQNAAQLEPNDQLRARLARLLKLVP